MKRLTNVLLYRVKMTISLIAITTSLQAASLSDLIYNEEGGYYEIASVSDLKILAEYVNSRNNCTDEIFKVTIAELDFDGVEFTPIGNSIYEFDGTFDGQGVVIKNIQVNMPDKSCIGLFGTVGMIGVIKNITLDESCTFIGDSQTGGVAGENNGTIENCSNHGAVKGGMCVGGIVGENSTKKTAAIINCISSADVTGSYYVAGIAGKNGHVVEECLVSGGTIKGGDEFTNNIAAVVGSSDGYEVNNFYYNNVKVVIGNTVYEGIIERGCDKKGLKDITFDSGAVLAYDFSRDLNKLDKRTFEIRSLEDMRILADIINLGYKSFGQTFKVTVPELDFSKVSYRVIGDSLSQGFSATFDGQGVIVSNLEIVDTLANNIGLFGRIESGTIKNIILDKTCHINVNTTVGGIVGYNYGGLVENCINYGTIEGVKNVGGIVGYMRVGRNEVASAKDNKNYGVVDGTTNIGGIVGYVYSSNMSISRDIELGTCQNNGKVNEKKMVGGIIGQAECSYFKNGFVEHCNNKGVVVGKEYVGGIVGQSKNINYSRCCNDSIIEGQCIEEEELNCGYIGGIAGALTSGTMEYCLNRGNISGPRTVGGLVGINGGELRFSICDSCRISVFKDHPGFVGAIAGYDISSKLTENYYYVETIVVLGESVFDGNTPRGLGKGKEVYDRTENNGAVLSLEKIESSITSSPFVSTIQNECYDLNGRKIKLSEGTYVPQQKGIYILNGK